MHKLRFIDVKLKCSLGEIFRMLGVAKRGSASKAQDNVDVTSLARGATVSLIGKIGGRGIHALSQIVLARMLGPAVFGLYGIGWSLLRIAESFAPLGLHNGVIRFGAQYYREDQANFKGIVLLSLRWAFLAASFLGAVEFLLAPWLEQVYAKPGLLPVIRGFAIALPLAVGLKVTAATTRISHRMKYSLYTEDMGQPILNIGIFLILFVFGWRLNGAIVAGALSFGLMYLLALYYVRRLFPVVFASDEKPRYQTRELLKFALPTTLVGIFPLLTTWSDRLFLGYFRSASEVGIYQAIAQSSVLFTLALNGLNTTFTPMIASLYHKGETQRLEELFRVSTKWGLYLSLPIFLTLCFAPQAFIAVLFGREYVLGALPMVILTIGQLVNVGTGAVGFLLIMTGRQSRWLVISGTALLASVGLHLWLIPRLGLIGAAISTTISVSGLYLAGLFLVRQSLALWPYDRRYFKMGIATVLTSLFLLGLRLVPIQSYLFTLLLTGVISVGVFAATVFLLGLDTEDYEFVRLTKSRFVRGLSSGRQ